MRPARYIPPERAHNELIEVAVNAFKATRKQVHTLLRDGTGLDHPSYTAPDGSRKSMLEVDKVAENVCARILRDSFTDADIRVLGEETLWKFKDLDLRTHHLEGYGREVRKVVGAETRVTAIIDMIDGSDLVERHLGNWCSAMIVFKPGPSPTIFFSLVQSADDTIYGADTQGSFILGPKAVKGEPLLPLKGPEVRRLVSSDPASSTSIEDSAQIAICYYGQKYGHFAEMPGGIVKWAKETPAQDRLRFYNLAGNPMMARLANGDDIHVVFEHVGQYPHDAAPGAFIALQSEAHLIDFNGNPITVPDLAQHLMKPSGAKLKYILTSTKEIAAELANALRNQRTYYECPQRCGPGIVAQQALVLRKCSVCGGELRISERRLR